MSEARSVPIASDFPDCRLCQMWEDAGASWPRPCIQHYGGEPTLTGGSTPNPTEATATNAPSEGPAL